MDQSTMRIFPLPALAESSKRDKPSRGWKRWFILAGLFMVSFLEAGSFRTLSLFLDDFTFQFDVSTSYMGAIYGLISGMPYVLGKAPRSNW